MINIHPIYISILYTGFLGILAIILVPRDEIRRLSIFAIIYGAKGMY